MGYLVIQPLMKTYMYDLRKAQTSGWREEQKRWIENYRRAMFGEISFGEKDWPTLADGSFVEPPFNLVDGIRRYERIKDI